MWLTLSLSLITAPLIDYCSSCLVSCALFVCVVGLGLGPWAHHTARRVSAVHQCSLPGASLTHIPLTHQSLLPSPISSLPLIYLSSLSPSPPHFPSLLSSGSFGRRQCDQRPLRRRQDRAPRTQTRTSGQARQAMRSMRYVEFYRPRDDVVICDDSLLC